MPTCYRHPGRESYIRCQHCDRPICPDCMHDAAVGFQCPSCIAEGKKSTRSGRTAYGGLRSGNPTLTTLVLIGLNVAVWLSVLATGGSASTWLQRIVLLPTGRCAAVGSGGRYYPGVQTEQICDQQGDGLWIPGVADGALWQLLTSAFAHVEIWHIAGNMLLLFLIGPQIEAAVGRSRFLALYLLAALAGSAAVYWLDSPDGSTLGASGAVSGLIAALLVMAIKVGGDVRGILTYVAIMAVISIALPGISWQGHLGGFVGGFLVAGVLVYSPRQRRTLWQSIGLAVVALGLVAAILARTAVLS
jgi:membrane associated rhomboid family serine protease